QRATIEGTADSGPGRLLATGSVVYQQGQIEGNVQLRGSDFLLVNLPEYVIRVTPDVSFLFSGEKGIIEGKVEVPYGMITPEEMVDSVTVSEDVVFVDESGQEVEAKGWPFGLDLEVILGDEVRIDGYGLTGRLGGRLKVGTSKDNLLIGRGQLRLIDGVFSLYGRTFDIKRGRVLFNGGPIENPGLDVRAQVEVSDQQTMGSGYTVGVDISGLAENPRFSLFSTPYMNDKEILSLMVFGKSLAGSSEEESNMLQTVASSLGLKGVSDLAKGLGNLLPVDDLHLEGSGQKEDVSLVVGKRIFEDFYVGYDMNMFSQTGQFRIHYDLTRGFSVETRSSSESTGADLFYSFER
ncbi:MAG: translocation/assembly module TamB domain-containing protein, partial [Desulforhopalus sp.]